MHYCMYHNLFGCCWQIAAGIMKCLLSLSTQDVIDPMSYPIVGPEIFLLRLKDTLPQYLSLTDADLEQYLTVLAEDGVSG